MKTQIAGKEIDLDAQGYLTDLGQWNRNVAEAIAREEEISLSDEHWLILEFLQEQYKNDIPLTIRKVGKSGLVDIKGFYTLFPNGPLKKASRIAGIPKPASCI